MDGVSMASRGVMFQRLYRHPQQTHPLVPGNVDLPGVGALLPTWLHCHTDKKNFNVPFSFAPWAARLPLREGSLTMILRSKARLACAGLVALSLAGCGVTPIAPNVDTPGMPNAEVALQKSLDDTAREMARIGAIEPSAAVASKPTVVAGELDRVVSMQWNGALDGAVRRLGETIGYRTAVTGKAPQAGVNVVVDPAPRRVYDILHGLGDEAGDAATVRVDEQHQLLEVIYHG